MTEDSRAYAKNLIILNARLTHAAATGDMEGVKAALASGAEAFRAIEAAAACGQPDIVWLLMQKVDRNKNAEELNTAFESATDNGHPQTAHLLAAFNSGRCRTRREGARDIQINIRLALATATGDAEGVKQALADGAGARRAIETAANIGNTEILKILGAKILKSQDNILERALAIAAGDGNAEMAAMLMAAGVNPQYALNNALENGHGDIAEAAIKAGGNIISNPHHFSGLCLKHEMFNILDYMEATGCGKFRDISGMLGALSPKSAAYVLDHGINATDILSEAVKYNRSDLIEMLMARGTMSADSILVRSVELNSPFGVETALAHGADVNANDGKPLQAAIEVPNDKLVRLLLEKGADAGRNASSCLEQVARSGIPEIIPDLIAHGAKMEESGKKALEIAINWGKDKAIRSLLAHGANLMDGIAYALNSGNLSNFLPHIQNCPPDAFDPTETLRLAAKHRGRHLTSKGTPQDSYISFLNLLKERGADLSALSPQEIPPELAGGLVAKGLQSPGFFVAHDLFLPLKRLRYLLSSGRPDVAMPEDRPALAAPPLRDAWGEGILRAREAGKDIASAAGKGGMPAFLAMLAANAEKLADMADLHNLCRPELRAELREKARAWREASGKSPALDAATENAAAYAEPKLLCDALSSLPSADARMKAAPLVKEHAAIFHALVSGHAELLARDSALNDVATRADAFVETAEMAVLRKKLSENYPTHVAQGSLEKLENLAGASGADAAIAILMSRPQSFDIHFMGPRIGRFRPWVWLRRKFHADSWHWDLADYRAHLKTWQEKDPDGSFATLGELLKLRHKLAQKAAPYAARKAASTESATFFVGVAEGANEAIGIASALSPENDMPNMESPLRTPLFQPLPETQEPESPRPPMPTPERQ